MQYRLRTLLIVLAAIGGCLGWIAWQKRVVANRQSVSRQLEQRGAGAVIWEGTGWMEPVKLIVAGDKSRSVSVIRRWLGDENAQAILLIPGTDTRPIVSSFPEADVYYHDLGYYPSTSP